MISILKPMKAARVQFLRCWSWMGFLSQRGMVLISSQSLERFCWMLDGINMQILASCHCWPGLATLSFLKYFALGKNKGLTQQNGNPKTRTQYKMLKPPWTKQRMGTCGDLRKEMGRPSNFIVQSRSRIVMMQTRSWSEIDWKLKNFSHWFFTKQTRQTYWFNSAVAGWRHSWGYCILPDQRQIPTWPNKNVCTTNCCVSGISCNR